MRVNKYFIRILILSVLSVVVFSCANMASPSGGDYDFDPPVVVKSTPAPNQLHVKNGKVEIIFDELVQIEKPMEKVIITPPQQTFPVIRAQSNKVIVDLKDTLKANTTYTIDFTDAIADNNEKNVLENFAISFSTGDFVDTLSISGRVLAADNLEPVSGMYVGIHSDLSDTAFTKLPFLRISRTNDLGTFTIKGVAPGKYKIYALNDLNRDYKYDNPSESIAFLETVLIPSTQEATRQDSIHNDITKKDTLVTVNYTRFLPDDIVLRSFTSDFKRQYLQKSERITDDAFSIFFGAPTEMPKIEPLNIKEDINSWSILEKTAGNDTLKYWITKPDIAQLDTISLKISYYKTDTLNIPQMTTDTLTLINRNRKAQLKQAEKKEAENKKKKNKKQEEDITYLSLNTDIGAAMDVYKKINLEFDYPILDLTKEQLRLQHKEDSIYTDLSFVLIQDTLNPRKYTVDYKWKDGDEYKFSVDSASIHAYNGLWNDKLDVPFKVKTYDQYGNLYINIHSLPENTFAFVELLDKSDKPVRQATVKDGGVLFMNLNPGTYYARITLDSNNMGKWQTGDFAKKRQPDLVYYYNKSFDIKANWDIEEDWNITELPLEKQKPLEITKNKPKDKDDKKRQMERRDAQQEKTRKQQEQKNRTTTSTGTYSSQTTLSN